MQHARDAEVRVERVPLASLKAYEGNAKRHTYAQLDAIEASIREFGFSVPIVAWHNEDGVPEIVAGHGRAEAARKLGMETVPVVFVDSLTDVQRRALVHVDNQTSMMTGFDRAKLARELQELSDCFDAEDFGFDPVDVSDMLSQGEPDGQLSKDELREFEADADRYLKSTSVMLRCETDEQVAWLSDRLGFDGDSPRRFYRAEDLMQND